MYLVFSSNKREAAAHRSEVFARDLFVWLHVLRGPRGQEVAYESQTCEGVLESLLADKCCTYVGIRERSFIGFAISHYPPFLFSH